MIFQKEAMIQATLITLPVQIALVTDANICITAKGNVLEKAPEMTDYKWMQDEICVNAYYPMCSDYCPVVDVTGVCRFEERSDDNG